MSTSYWLACQDCTPPHVHRDESYEATPEGMAMAHSSGRWGIDPDRLDQEALMVSEYGEVLTVAEVRLRTGRQSK